MTVAPESTYRPVDGWGPPPPVDDAEGSDVAIDSHGNVYILTKPPYDYDCMAPGQLQKIPTPDAQPRLDPRPAARHRGGVHVYDRAGRFLRSWGEGQLADQPHGLTIGPDDSVYIALRDDNTVRKFTSDGEQLAVLGTSGLPSDSGIDWQIRDLELRRQSIQRGAPPFNNPTKVGIAPNGDLYVTDGYANASVHRFSAEGELILSWGQPGSGPGEFRLPHSVAITSDGRVLVADRENARVQVFDTEGKFLDQWTGMRVNSIVIDDESLVYLNAGRGVSILTLDGEIVERIEGLVEPTSAGHLTAPHGLARDADGSLYIAQLNRPPGDTHWRMVQKFVRRS
jgi:DNA-binding beta-propeller fold protein YncE